jgi:DNA-binding response OmpR family regulator
MKPPRIVIVIPGQWPRALLRAELRERGYDAVGAASLAEALVYPAREEGRGPVALLVVDATALGEEGGELLGRLVARHQDPLRMLITPSRDRPPGDWTAVLRRPLRKEQLHERIRALLPLTPDVEPLALEPLGVAEGDPRP